MKALGAAARPVVCATARALGRRVAAWAGRIGARRQRAWVFGALVLALLSALSWWSLPRAISFVHVELGGIAYERGLAFQAGHPQEPNPYFDRALRHLQKAVAFDAGNAHAWRMLGELYLALGQNESARWALERAVDLRPDQPAYRILLGDAFDGLGLAPEALEAWAAGRGKIWRKEKYLVNLMKLADAHIAAGDPLSALPYLRDQVLPLEPGNLFALAVVVSTYDGLHPEGRDPFVDPYREALAYPELEALRMPEDPRYARFQAKAVQLLWERHYWEGTMVARLLRLWAWQAHPGALALASYLCQAEPTNGTWCLLVAEAQWRRGELAAAESALEQCALRGEEWLRLRGLVALARAREEGSRELWEAARQALAEWQLAAPDDLMPVAGLLEVTRQLADAQESSRWQELYMAMTSGVDVQVAAQALGVPVEMVRLGPNLVTNASFAQWSEGRPKDWIWSFMATGQPWNKGFFLGGPEPAAPEGPGMRVDCLWVQQKEGLEPARAGFWHYDEERKDLRQISLEPGRYYVVSFDYRTEDVAGPEATVWLSYKPSPCWAGDLRLPPTGGRWRHAAFACGPSQEGDDALRPLLRLFGPGSAAFDNFAIRVIETAPR